MNKAFILLSILFLLVSCDNRTPKQKASDEYNKEVAMQDAAKMEKEHIIDSLVNVAGGLGEYKYQRANRLNALKILKKEYPEIDWSKIEADIYK
jgi:hypothetical protein